MLTGIPPAPRGTPQVEVSFDIDANGIMNVSAKDMATGKKQGITITASNKLSKEEIDKMLKQADQFAEQDRTRAKSIELRNRAEALTYEAERVLEENKGKIAEADAGEVREKIAALRTALSEKDPKSLEPKLDDLTRALHKVAQKLYDAARTSEPEGPRETGPEPGSAPPPGASTPPPTGGASPVDADFKVVDKESGEQHGP
jgi:molecular chaperone DnaK